MTDTIVRWTHTEIHIGPFTLLVTTSEIMFILGFAAFSFGAVLMYGRLTHTLQIHGGRKAAQS